MYYTGTTEEAQKRKREKSVINDPLNASSPCTTGSHAQEQGLFSASTSTFAAQPYFLIGLVPPSPSQLARFVTATTSK